LSINKKLVTDSLFIVSFSLMIGIIFLFGFFKDDQKISKYEKRNLASAPSFPESFKQWVEFPKNFNYYYSEQFSVRQNLLTLYSYIKLKCGESAVKDVTVGKEEWLFIGGIHQGKGRFDDAMGDYMNINKYTDEELNSVVEYYSNLQKWLESMGIEFLLVITPSKHSIYPEYLPAYIQKISEESSLDQFGRVLNKNTNVNYLDLRQSLIKGKKSGLLYFPQDTHWNAKGANIAQYEILSKVNSFLPLSSPPKYFQMTERRAPINGDLLNMLSLDSKTGNRAFPIIPNLKRMKDQESFTENERHVWSNDDEKLKVVIFRNSMLSALKLFLISHFKKITFIWEQVNLKSIKKELSIEKPDIIIEQLSERQFPILSLEMKFLNDYIMNMSPKGLGKLVFNNNWNALKFTPVIKISPNNSGVLTFKSIGVDPTIYFNRLTLNNRYEYLINLKMKSNVASSLSLFYSVINDREMFCQKRCITHEIKEGFNEISIKLYDPYLGPYLRLDPIIAEGTITIESLTIKSTQHR